MKTPSHNRGNSRLKRKNKQLKQKIKRLGGMSTGDDNIPPQIENAFLKSVLDFEENFRHAKQIKILDKLGKDFTFKALHEIPDDQIEKEFHSLHKRMADHGIDLSCCSPNISARELYRFCVEELFQLEVDDMDVPGMMNCYFYDEFHPDVKYDNERLVMEDCIKPILSNRELHELHLRKNVTFNGKFYTAKAYCEAVNKFHHQFQQVSILELPHHTTELTDVECRVSGLYKASFLSEDETYTRSGNWTVDLSLDALSKYWYIYNIELEEIDFECPFPEKT